MTPAARKAFDRAFWIIEPRRLPYIMNANPATSFNNTSSYAYDIRICRFQMDYQQAIDGWNYGYGNNKYVDELIVAFKKKGCDTTLLEQLL